MYRFIPPVAVYAQVCWLLCVLYAIVWLSSGFVLWLAYLIGSSKVVKVGGKQKPYEMWQAGISLAASPLANSLASFARDGICSAARPLTNPASYAGYLEIYERYVWSASFGQIYTVNGQENA